MRDNDDVGVAQFFGANGKPLGRDAWSDMSFLSSIETTVRLIASIARVALVSRKNGWQVSKFAHNRFAGRSPHEDLWL